jgi:DNA-binding response OmpR family regulator
MNDLKRICIAVVENYAAQREELELLLRLEGFEVFGADSGQSLDRLLLMGGFKDQVQHGLMSYAF